MKFSVLHLSDLHRDLSDEIQNNWLLDSLAQDFSQYSQQVPPIQMPQLCVVSGDLVFGAKIGNAHDVELTRQYKQTEEFLIGFTNRFFQGDREKVVLVPGNHDVSFEDAHSSMQRVEIPADSAEKTRLIKELFAPKSKLRWSWSDLCFYRIVDEVRYKNRFRHFAAMYDSFYQGRRSFPVGEGAQFDVFDFPQFKFSVIGLNSCYNNDMFRRAGEIDPAALTSAAREARRMERAGWLIAAAWHHNLAGGPLQNDYMDAAFVQILIDSGVALSFHGHQHLSECFDERYRLGPKPRKMTVISAGTLCAEPRHLRPGVPRSYNLVEIDIENWSGRVHLRQMVNMMFDMPIWGAGSFISTGNSYLDFDICKPPLERPAGLDVELALESLANLVGQQRWRDALDSAILLKDHALAKPFLLKTLEALDEPETTISVLGTPSSTAEAVILGGALLEVGNSEQIQDFMRLDIVKLSTDSSLLDISKRVARRVNK